MIKKIALLFVAALTLQGCNDINYDSETRLVMEGQLADNDGNPIPNQDIDIAVYNDDPEAFANGNAYPDDVISYGYSDDQGRFKLVIPAPKGYNDNIGVRINRYSDRYQKKEFLLIRRADFVGYRFDLHQIKLYKTEEISNLMIDAVAADPSHELRKITVEGLLADQYVYVNPIPVAPYEQHQVRINQTVTIHYEVAEHNGNNTVITQNSVAVPIGSSQTTNYTLMY